LLTTQIYLNLSPEDVMRRRASDRAATPVSSSVTRQVASLERLIAGRVAADATGAESGLTLAGGTARDEL
jgi:hypothetical protein